MLWDLESFGSGTHGVHTFLIGPYSNFAYSLQIICDEYYKKKFIELIKFYYVLELGKFRLRYTGWAFLFYWMMVKFGIQLRDGSKLTLPKNN